MSTEKLILILLIRLFFFVASWGVWLVVYTVRNLIVGAALLFWFLFLK